MTRMRRSYSTEFNRTADNRLFREWTASVTVGELAGFCVPALVGSLVLGTSTPVAVALMVAAGSVEGAVLGWSQARVLVRVLPELSIRRWIVGTAIAAAFAWLIGLLPSTFGSALSAWPVGVLVVVGVILGTLLLCSIGTAQWVELRRDVPEAGWWILVTAAAWCAGLLAFFPVTSLLWQPGQPVLLVAAIGALGGLIMAVTMAATSGWALVRLFGSAWVPGPSQRRRLRRRRRVAGSRPVDVRRAAVDRRDRPGGVGHRVRRCGGGTGELHRRGRRCRLPDCGGNQAHGRRGRSPALFRG